MRGDSSDPIRRAQEALLGQRRGAARTSLGLVELERNLTHANRELIAAIDRIAPTECDYYCSIMEMSFREVWVAEAAGNSDGVTFVKDIFYTAAKAAMRQLDRTGVTAAIGGLVSQLRGFSYEANAASLSFESFYLIKTLGVPPEKVARFWPYVDQHKDFMINLMSSPGFRLQSLVEPAKRLFDATGGEAWQHMSPGFWTRMAGLALACTNVGLAVGTVGLGAPVAVASVLAGAAGVADPLGSQDAR